MSYWTLEASLPGTLTLRSNTHLYSFLNVSLSMIFFKHQGLFLKRPLSNIIYLELLVYGFRFRTGNFLESLSVDTLFYFDSFHLGMSVLLISQRNFRSFDSQIMTGITHALKVGFVSLNTLNLFTGNVYFNNYSPLMTPNGQVSVVSKPFNPSRPIQRLNIIFVYHV